MANYVKGLGGCDYCQNCAANNPCAAPAPVITSAATASGSTGSAFSYTITGTNSPTSFLIVAGTFIPGTSLNTSTGVLSGTPPSGYAGTYVMTISATNACGSGTQVLTVTISGSTGGGGGVTCTCTGISMFNFQSSAETTVVDEAATVSALACDTVCLIQWFVTGGAVSYQVTANGSLVYTSPTISYSGATIDGGDYVTLPAGTTSVHLISTSGESGVSASCTLDCP